jgi:TatA/E family protein of Tat protein translocase
MFSFHWPELLIIAALAAILFPKRLPGIAGGLGRGIRNFRHSVREIEEQSGVRELRESGQEEVRALKELATIDLTAPTKPQPPVSPAQGPPGAGGSTPPGQ